MSGSFFNFISFMSSSETDFFLDSRVLGGFSGFMGSFFTFFSFFILSSSSYGVGSKSGSLSADSELFSESGDGGFVPLGLRRFDDFLFG